MEAHTVSSVVVPRGFDEIVLGVYPFSVHDILSIALTVNEDPSAVGMHERTTVQSSDSERCLGPVVTGSIPFHEKNQPNPRWGQGIGIF